MLTARHRADDRSSSAAVPSRVYYLSYSEIPSRSANAVQVIKMCAAFVRQSFEVVLFCRRRPGTSSAAVREFYGVSELFEVRGRRFPRVPILGHALHSAWVLLQLARAPRPDLIYGRDAFALALVAACRFPRAPIAFEVHRPPAGRVEELMHRMLLSSPRLERVVVISDALRAEYIRRFGERVATKIVLARDAADQICEPADVRAPNEEAFQLGYVGSLSSGKGLQMVVKLAALLPDCRFVVIGGSPAEVERWRAQADSDNLVFQGFVPPENARAQMCRFDALLAPYQERVPVGRKQVDVGCWMSPLKIFEYMAAGKPIVASDLPILREFLRHGENALLAPAQDEHAWAARIRELQHDPALRERLGARGRQEFLGAYTWDHRARRVLALEAKS